MDNAPLVSVVMSVYNSAPTLERSIESILGQGLKGLEFIIIDDGSSDSSARIMQRYAAQDARVRIFTQENRGLTASLNRGIRASRGAYIARQDADDASLPERLQRQVFFLKKGYDFCCCRTKVRQTETVHPRLASVYLHRLMVRFKNVFMHGTFCFRKKIFEELGGYDEAIAYAQDYDFVCRVVKKGYAIKFLPDVLYISDKDRDCISKTRLAEQKASLRAVRRKYFFLS